MDTVRSSVNVKKSNLAPVNFPTYIYIGGGIYV
jgi:hypothetical protein